MTIRDRILYYLEYKSISKYRFYKETGISNGFLDKEGAIGTDKCAIICSHYPDISLEWLLLGKGLMLKTAESSMATNSEISYSSVGDSVAIKQLIDKIVELIAENENLKSEIGVLKSYKYDYNSNLGIVAENKAEYGSKQKKE